MASLLLLDEKVVGTDVCGWDQAIAVLTSDETGFEKAGVGPVGRHWRDRAAAHLAERLQAVLREGLPPATPLGEREARAVIQQLQDELRQAGAELAQAAQQLRNEGRAYQAGLTMTASLRAKAAAGEV